MSASSVAEIKLSLLASLSFGSVDLLGSSFPAAFLTVSLSFRVPSAYTGRSYNGITVAIYSYNRGNTLLLRGYRGCWPGVLVLFSLSLIRRSELVRRLEVGYNSFYFP